MTHRLVVFILIMTGFFLYVNPAESSAGEIVNPHVTYTFSQMERDIRDLERTYPHLIQVEVIGKSEYGRPIYAVGLGTGNATTFINGSHHAREWISTSLTMYMIDQYARMHERDMTYGGFNVRKVLDETTIWFVPMLNPDGVILQQQGLSAFPASMHPQLRRMNDGSNNFRRWKANAKGVDLNRQYAAGWNTIRNNSSQPSWTHHKGFSPMSSAETKAIVDFTRKIDPEIAVSYHSSGEVLYWKYKQTGSRLLRDQRIARRISQYTGYRMIDPGPNPSGGGYTDWFIKTYQRPAVTPELGVYAGHTHVPVSAFGRIWNQNRFVGLYTASEGYQLYLNRGGEPKPPPAAIAINGTKTDITGSLINGAAYVPLMETGKAMNLLMEEGENPGHVKVRHGQEIMAFRNGASSYTVNGRSVSMNHPAQLYRGHLMVPARALMDGLRQQVTYDSAARVIGLSYSPPADTTPPDQPQVEPVTDITTAVTGITEVNALIEIGVSDRIIGRQRAGIDGMFSIPIPARRAGDVVTVTATDLAGNKSEPVLTEVQYTSYFLDSKGHWAERDIGFLKDRGVTSGYTDGRFGTQDPVRRAEVAALLVRATEMRLIAEQTVAFPDVTAAHPFHGEIATLSSNGVMGGDQSGHFMPERAMTRAEMARVLTEAFGLRAFTGGREGTDFPDIGTAHWARDPIAVVTAAGIASGYPDGRFKPNQPVTRAEFAALLARSMRLVDDGNPGGQPSQEQTPEDESESGGQDQDESGNLH